MMLSKYILEARNISKEFYLPVKHNILKNNNLVVKQGDLITIHGESGSGKSTLLYILATLDTQFEGDLIINNTIIKTQSQSFLSDFRNKNIGFVYQSHYLLQEFNVLHNVLLPAFKSDKKNKEQLREKASKLLTELGLSSYLNYPVYKLSGGQQQRVAIARALINNPKLIIADEPTGNLDQKNSQMIFELLQKISSEQKTAVIIATHDPKIYNNSNISYEMTDGVLRLS
ncbi:ATP-binding cassette domain-containing protein [Flavobacteriaceae bacterium R38]|nr:ATP-binding cassette domain-containing protein [Flavobacteriaceae bacterium R38]